MRAFLGCMPAMFLFGVLGLPPAAAADPAGAGGSPGAPRRFTPLVPLPAPKVLASSEPYPGMPAGNLLDGKENTEYSSKGKGLETFLDLDFGRPTRIAAYRHVDRADPATVAAAELLFSDSSDFAKPVARVKVPHANVRSGRTLFILPAAATARYVRWQVTGLGPRGYGTVGGAEIGFFTSADPEPAPTRDTIELACLPAVELRDGKPMRAVRVKIDHPYAEPADAVLEISGVAPRPMRLDPRGRTLELALPALDRETTLAATIRVAAQAVVRQQVALKPVRHWTIYLLPHSHVDIGYTNVQTEVEKLHWKFLDEALELCRKTADYPPEARFKWNSEVLWQVDSYLKRLTPEKREQFIAAVRAGQIELDALYGNELTGLCRPEELFRLTGCARRLAKQYGVSIDTAMISDVPGYTWGIVPALAQSGIKYFSIGTNHVHRIGNTLERWGDKPFYWVSPSGREKVLCWVAGKGYSGFHPGLWDRITKVKPEALLEYLEKLETSGFPYDLAQLRYSIGGDNGPPDPDLPDFVKKWNAQYVWPKLRIATGHELMEELERRFGAAIPEVRGDFTPYWEDGAGSSSLETALARTAAERLVQAETLFALLRPEKYPAEDFYQAWRNVLLYNEHTWGAHSSISQPDSDFTKAQWKIKRAFAVDGDRQSRGLLAAAVAGRSSQGSPVAAVDVFNTNSWPRTDLVILPVGLKTAGSAVKDAEGRAVPSQRLSTGELAFVASDVPPLGARRFRLAAGEPASTGSATAEGRTLKNAQLRIVLDEQTGGIAGLAADGIAGDLAAGGDKAGGLNEYFYVAGRDPKSPQRSSGPKFRVKDRGPLVASLVVESAAPGCRGLIRELRVVDGLRRVDVVNVIDKARVRTPESVHFGCSPNVPGGVMRMDIPWAVIRPEQDQLPGACKNYFSVGRWIDVSNERFGLACATLDAPLAEVGAITVDVPSPFDPKVWIKTLVPAQTFYWYVMNNYWETNYKSDQEGPTTFRYALAPHGPFDPLAAARFGIERSQPLVVVPVAADAPPVPSLVRVEPAGVMVTSLKPAEDGKGLVLRLHNAGTQPAQARLAWSEPAPKRVTLSSPREEEGAPVTGPIEIVPSGIVTLRVAR